MENFADDLAIIADYADGSVMLKTLERYVDRNKLEVNAKKRILRHPRGRVGRKYEKIESSKEKPSKQ